MASHYADNLLHGSDHTDTHASDSRWRHQESNSFGRHASKNYGRPADRAAGSNDLANVLNQSRVDPAPGSTSGNHKQIISQGFGNGLENADGTNFESTEIYEEIEVKCGPLLNYRRMESGSWFGSILIVTKGTGANHDDRAPKLLWSMVGARAATTPSSAQNNGGAPQIHTSDITTGEQTNGPQSHTINGVDYGGFDKANEGPTSKGVNGINGSNGVGQNGHASESNSTLDHTERNVLGTKLYSDEHNTFWRFDLQVPMQDKELEVSYHIPGIRYASGKEASRYSFFIPAITDSMRIMFHSCNGFSVGTDEAAWSGPCLWNDVLRMHKKNPFHVMLGGGDQIYNDGIRVSGPLRQWTDISNPKKRRDYPFPESLRKDCDDYYVNNYIRWYSTEPFAPANAQIPQVNLWDDHDIIDGFGSYVQDFMECAVFKGIGGVAYKYYMLFQHHLAPPVSSFTSDAPETTEADAATPESAQLHNTYVYTEPKEDSPYIIGPKPGPYVEEKSRSIYTRLGARIGFFGLDARTERTRHQVNYPETYQVIFDRLRRELTAAPEINHLIVLLGIPIAYPRLTWLENIFSSPVMGPVKFLNKRFGVGGGIFNHFDGSVDLLDDLDDHYTASAHKKERRELIQELQGLSSEFSVRITILGGDVHLAALGRFYSNPKLNIPIEKDHRYMANIISSAIVNKPPPPAVANLLARRNKLHHLDEATDETLLKLFDKDPGSTHRTANHNNVTMPSRNWAMITENSTAPPPNISSYLEVRQATPTTINGRSSAHGNGSAIGSAVGSGVGSAVGSAVGSGSGTLDSRGFKIPKHGHYPLHRGEQGAGTTHRAAGEQHGLLGDGGLDVMIRVEIDQHDAEGKTQGYGLNIPMLELISK